MVGIGGTFGAILLCYSYTYAQIDDKVLYQKSTSIIAAGFQLGQFVGDLISQLLVIATDGNYVMLPYINASCNRINYYKYFNFSILISVYISHDKKKKINGKFIDLNYKYIKSTYRNTYS